MAVSQNVLQLINNIEHGKKDSANQIRWDDLSAEDRNYLFEQAQKRWVDDRKGFELLQSIYGIPGIDTYFPLPLFRGLAGCPTGIQFAVEVSVCQSRQTKLNIELYKSAQRCWSKAF